MGQTLPPQQAERGDYLANMALPEVARHCLKHDGLRVASGDVDWVDVVRDALEFSRSFADAMSTATTAQVVRGYAAARAKDPTAGLCRIPKGVRDFKQQERVSPSKLPTPDRLSRGGVAGEVDPDYSSPETYRIARFAKHLTVDEQTILDDRLEALGLVFESMGREAAQLRPRLVWSIVLNNAALADTGALFNSTAVTSTGGHANLGTGALAAAGLQTGTAAMRAQSMADASGTRHTLNIAPLFLFVSGDLEQTAAALLRSLQLGQGGDLFLRVDSRLGANGVVCPSSGEVVTGSETAWHLFASPGDAPVVEVGYRDDRRSPRVTQTRLANGQWGYDYAVNLDLGAKAVGWRGAYASTGAG